VGVFEYVMGQPEEYCYAYATTFRIEFPRQVEAALDWYIWNCLTMPVLGLMYSTKTASVEKDFEILQRFRYCGASDPKDKVYALMGILKVSSSLPNLKSCRYDLAVAEVFSCVTVDMMKSDVGCQV